MKIASKYCGCCNSQVKKKIFRNVEHIGNKTLCGPTAKLKKKPKPP